MKIKKCQEFKPTGSGRKFLHSWILTNLNDDWQKAFEFFKTRLDTRYIEPMKDLVETKKEDGIGFSITAIFCTLIEFLATMRSGEKYKNCTDKNQAVCDNELFEYCNSTTKFVKFIQKQQPFEIYFSNSRANDFYTNVRCPLLHEARTTNYWKIRKGEDKDNRKPFEFDGKHEKFVYRNKLVGLIEQYLQLYHDELRCPNSVELRAAFKRKMEFQFQE